MSYLKWNDLIAQHFFNEEMAGKEVLLFVDKELINEIGTTLNENYDDFIQSVITGPPWVQKHAHKNYGICQKALLTLEKWRNKKYLKYPPYIGYLAVFVLAGYVQDSNYSQAAYYPKLRKILGDYDGIGMYPSFDKMNKLWRDLEFWSIKDELEEIGRFKMRIRGKWKHVGLPLSQTIITSKERSLLPVIFNRAGILASDSPSNNILLRILLKYGADVLSKKTIKLLNGEEKNSQLRHALIELVNDELNDWDGSIPSVDTDSKFFLTSRMRICLKLNKASKEASFSIRINTQHDFPEGTLSFQKVGDQKRYNCKKSIDNWSTELKCDEKQVLNANQLNWLKGENLRDSNNKWKTTLKGAPIRVFTKGGRFGLPNYVETARVERRSSFILVCHSDFNRKIEKWGKISCDSFARVTYDGLPKDWSMYSIKNPSSSCVGINELTLSPELKPRLVNGLRLGKGNTFLYDYPPNVVIANQKGSELVTVNGKQLSYDGISKEWIMLKNLPLNERLTIKIIDIDIEVSRLHFKLSNPGMAIKTVEDMKKIMGLSKDALIIGSNVYNMEFILPNEIRPLPTFLSDHIYFIGKNLGEIYEWKSKEHISLDWNPVWAIYHIGGKKWSVYYCSNEKIEDSNVSGKIKDVKKVRSWKAVLCNMKKAIIKPEFQPLRRLWDRYVEEANNV